MSCDAIDAATCQFLCSGGEYSMDSIYPFTHPKWISLFKTIYLHWNMHNALAQHSFFNIRIYEYGYRKLTVTTPPNPLHWLVFFSFCASFSLSGCVSVCLCFFDLQFSTWNFNAERTKHLQRVRRTVFFGSYVSSSLTRCTCQIYSLSFSQAVSSSLT